MHDPIGATAMWGSTDVVHEGLFHPHGAVAMGHRAVLSSGLPVALLGGAVGPGAIPILAVQHAEEVPFQVLGLELGQS